MIRKRNQEFTYNGRDYTNSVNNAINSAKYRAEYPDNAYLKGVKSLRGERAVFRLIIDDELKKRHVPKELREFLSTPD